MALTISAITPNTGRTGGRYVVAIEGTGFALPAVYTGGGVAPTPPPSMRVLFGATPALRVDVLSDSRLSVLVPAVDPGSVVVSLSNLSDVGAVVETATLAGGFTFKRPDLTQTAQRSSIVLVVRALVQGLRREVLENTVVMIHTDFDGSPADGLDITTLTKLPAIVLAGPTLRTNRLYALNNQRVVPVGNGDVQSELHRTPVTKDLIFSLTVASTSTQELLTLMPEIESYFARNIHLDVGDVRYEMHRQFNNDFSVTGKPSRDNLRQASMSFAVRGVDIEDFASEVDAVYRVQEDALINVVPI